MPRLPDSGQLNLAQVFHLAQRKLLADLATTGSFEHPSANGTATEQIWIELFSQYLPTRYRATPAFIINSSGLRSRQIDIAIYDNLSSPPLFPNPAGIHIPIESVYAVFEVKPLISKQWLQDAAEKAASVRALRPTNRKILAGLLAATSVWRADNLAKNLRPALNALPASHRINLGCALEHASFEYDKTLTVSEQHETLIFFVLRLINRLNALGPAPPTDLMHYVSGLESFKRWS